MCSEIYRFAPEPGAFCGPVLPGRAWPVPYNGPAEPFWCIQCGRAGTGGTHKCVPYRDCAAVGVHPTNRPRLHPQFWERPDECAAPRRGRGHARPVPHVQFWGRPDLRTRRVGNAFMRSETRPFAPEPVRSAGCRCRAGHGPAPTGCGGTIVVRPVWGRCWRSGQGSSGAVKIGYMEIQPKALATELMRMMAAKMGHRY